MTRREVGTEAPSRMELLVSYVLRAGVLLGTALIVVGVVQMARTGQTGDDGEEARRFTRARRGCGGMRTDPGAATGGGRPGSASAWGMS